MEDGPILCLCTAPDVEVAGKLARGLVEGRLAACVNLLPGMRSIYTWQGKVEDDAEVQLLIKTRRLRLPDIETYLDAHHPYDVPELVALPIEGGSQTYLAWLAEQTESA